MLAIQWLTMCMESQLQGGGIQSPEASQSIWDLDIALFQKKASRSPVDDLASFSSPKQPAKRTLGLLATQPLNPKTSNNKQETPRPRSIDRTEGVTLSLEVAVVGPSSLIAVASGFGGRVWRLTKQGGLRDFGLTLKVVEKKSRRPRVLAAPLKDINQKE